MDSQRNKHRNKITRADYCWIQRYFMCVLLFLVFCCMLYTYVTVPGVLCLCCCSWCTFPSLGLLHYQCPNNKHIKVSHSAMYEAAISHFIAAQNATLTNWPLLPSRSRKQWRLWSCACIIMFHEDLYRWVITSCSHQRWKTASVSWAKRLAQARGRQDHR